MIMEEDNREDYKILLRKDIVPDYESQDLLNVAKVVIKGFPRYVILHIENQSVMRELETGLLFTRNHDEKNYYNSETNLYYNGHALLETKEHSKSLYEMMINDKKEDLFNSFETLKELKKEDDIYRGKVQKLILTKRI